MYEEPLQGDFFPGLSPTEDFRISFLACAVVIPFQAGDIHIGFDVCVCGFPLNHLPGIILWEAGPPCLTLALKGPTLAF